MDPEEAKTTGGEGAAKEPPATPEPAKAAPAKETPAPALAPEKKTVAVEPAEIDESADIPANASLIQLTPQALSKRLDRYTKKQLEEHFGTADVAQIKSDLAELKVAREEKEAARRAALTEIDKAKEDAAREKKRAEEAESKLQKTLDSHTYAEYDRAAEIALTEHLDPEAVELGILKLKKHVLSLDDDELEDPSKVFETWAKDFAKKNPKYAKAAEAAPEPKKIKLNTGTDTRTRPEKSPVSLAEKTPRPGQPNSMSRAEVAQYKRQRGLSA